MSSEVSSIPELLEQVLVQLPIRDLLVSAPLVCKTWHAVTLLPSLQRALFFEPDPSLSVSQHVRNPLLIEMFSPFFDRCLDLEAMESMPWSEAPDAFKREEASWRRMLVSQPPVNVVFILDSRAWGMAGGYVRRAVLKDLSLRMGALYDLTVPLVGDTACFYANWGGTKLELQFSPGYRRQRDLGRTLVKRFRSNAEKPIAIPWGKWTSDGMCMSPS